MGMDLYTYTVFGVKFDEIDEDLLDYFHEGDHSFENMIEPLTSREYNPQFMVLGEVFSSLDRYDPEGIDERDPADLPAIEADFRKRFAEQYPDFTHLLEGKPFRILSFGIIM